MIHYWVLLLYVVSCVLTWLDVHVYRRSWRAVHWASVGSSAALVVALIVLTPWWYVFVAFGLLCLWGALRVRYLRARARRKADELADYVRTFPEEMQRRIARDELLRRVGDLPAWQRERYRARIEERFPAEDE